MSAQGAVEAALMAALKGHAALTGATNGVLLAGTGRATPPYVRLGESIAADWGTKDARGREIRVAVTLVDQGESAVRLHRLMAMAEEAIEGMARDADGWRLASIAFLRSRVMRDAAREWSGMIEYRVRAIETPPGP
ncbi:DUF3168 domain-containing protein [Sphingomonas cavernae]|uniref:DUF3168 domain-containing protein n=1 Tax=Sphingomonas cavernae TaxID=2320861 RepID=A0A418WL61_9SPHN|nr:DUF3168 domain-containing protein [Sphingomonas cavernae]RJF90784.1 DUF3168 domain-containing protein [Sphingomonas cavernae]